MNRVVLASVAVAALAGATVIGWFEVRQAREFRRLIAVGDAALSRGETSAAVEAYSGAIALRRDAMLGWLKRGDTYRRSGDFTSALRDLQQATTLDSTAPRPLELLGDVNAAIGQHGKATELYGRFVALDDRAPRVFYKLALAQYRAGHTSTAIDAARKALALDRQLVEAYYLLGLCERDSRRPDQAVTAFARAISINPAFAPAREELAALDITLGRRRDAVDQLEALAALKPDRAEYLVDLALSYARTGRFESALVTLARAAERYPQAASVFLATARIWLEEAEATNDATASSRARQALETADALDGHSTEFLVLRGRLRLLAGDARGAERALQDATASLPVDPDAFRYLADASARLGHRELAQIARARHAALAP